MPDNTNTPLSLPLTVVQTTLDSIHVSWEPLAEDDPNNPAIVYKVWITEEEDPANPWRLAKEGKGTRQFTFYRLKSDTGYGIFVQAFKDSKLVCQYPACKGCLTVRTKAPDPVAPTVESRALQLTNITYYSLTIQWKPATDNATKQEKIRYVAWIRPFNAPDDAWEKAVEKKGITSFTFEKLNIATRYAYYVEAFDEAGNCLRYPSDHGFSTGYTAADKTAPSVADKTIKVTGTTKDSISIRWEPATDNITKQDKIRYVVWILEIGTSNGTWQNAEDKAGITSFTFKNLKEATKYAIFVEAFDEAGNTLHYPSDTGTLTASTVTPERKATTVKSQDIEVTGTTRNSISIKWEPATDNVTKQNKIRYEVWLIQNNLSGNSWQKVEDKTGISSYTFRNLKAETSYSFYVKAYDEAGNSLHYPQGYGSRSARTLDVTAPTVNDRTIKVTGTSKDTISIQWTPATDNVTQQYKIRYQMWINSSGETYSMADEKTGISSYTFKNLKEATKYQFYIVAFDEAGNSIRYPQTNGTMSANTRDVTAPTVGNQALTVSNVRDTCFTISWDAAKDNVTPMDQIRYQVYMYEGGKWVVKKDAYGIRSHTFTGLTPGTDYFFYVKALDAAGNALFYPPGGESVHAKTIIKQVSKLSIHVTQKATVLKGTDTICLRVSYNAVRYNSQGVLVESQPGYWQRKWSSNNSASTVITLPENWFFEINQVYIYIDSRRAASAGLNTWKKCSDGYVDISKGTLNLTLTGSYYSYSVKYTVDP